MLIAMGKTQPSCVCACDHDAFLQRHKYQYLASTGNLVLQTAKDLFRLPMKSLHASFLFSKVSCQMEHIVSPQQNPKRMFT